MTDDVETRRRRAGFRAWHRGMKEMDLLVGRYANAHLHEMTPEDLAMFERALTIPDPVFHDMILYPEIAPAGEFASLVSRMRAFHGLE